VLLWILVAVFGRITGSCIASLQQKWLFHAGNSPSRIVALSMTLVAVGALALDWRFFVRAPDLQAVFWWLLVVSAFLDTVGNILLVRSVGAGELSVVGPLNSYKPVIASLIGYFFFRELPSWTGIGGMLAILIGSFMLIERRDANVESSKTVFSSAVFVRLVSIVFTSVASLFLKSAIEVSDSWTTFQSWGVVSAIVAWLLIRKVPTADDLQELTLFTASDYFVLAGSLILMQSLTVWLFSQLSVGYALALFQLASLVQVGLGVGLFGEKDLGRRLLAAAIMTAGAVVVLLSR
jgi:drug/metabolite transporter (DMT)-like permease